MTALVSIETVLLVLLIVLVAGLLRSHAELLRRLGPTDADPGTGPAVFPAAPSAQRDPGAPAPALSGSTPAGDVVKLSFERGATAPTLLAFLSTGCSTCAGFWEELGDHALLRGVQTVIVTKGAEQEQPAQLRALASAGVPVVMSSAAWRQYGVPGAPYFVLVDGSVRGEGVATTWQALASLVGDAVGDQRLAGGRPAGAAPRRDVDETLAAAGIGPEDPSLYPAGRERS